MSRSGGCRRVFACALAMLVACSSSHFARGEDAAPPDGAIVFLSAPADDEELPKETPIDELPPGLVEDEFLSPDDWHWQMLPVGLIYHSYWAGAHEPRTSINSIRETHTGRTLWDATVGGQGGVVRYGDDDPLHPQGWQLDVYGAAVARLDVDNRQDLDSTDYVFGFPLTYGIDDWAFKFGYGHISSHLGDELAIRESGTLDDRINYVRDSLVLGVSRYPLPAMRIYGEASWAFHFSDGAQPWAFQFGNELAHPGPTGMHGSPFLAINGRMREELNYGGDITTQTGWLWRGIDGKVFRLGAHYYTGKSSQFQFYKRYEEQIGAGLWYDF